MALLEGAYRLLYPSNSHLNINLIINTEPEFPCGIKVLCDPTSSLHTPNPDSPLQDVVPFRTSSLIPSFRACPSLLYHHQILHLEFHFSIVAYLMITSNNDIRWTWIIYWWYKCWQYLSSDREKHWYFLKKTKRNTYTVLKIGIGWFHLRA